DTADQVARRYPSVILLRQERNEGFARGNNLGLREAVGEWVLTLNPDAWLAPDWLETLLEFAKDKPHLGMAGGKILKPSEGSSAQIIDSLGIEIFRSRRVRDIGMGWMDAAIPAAPFRVFGICAAAALYRRSMLNDTQIRGEIFPERFFAYYEDADLAWRAWRRGWETWTIPTATAWHRRGGSPVGAKFSRRLTHRNRWWLIARNESFGETLLAAPEVYVHELLMILRVIRHPSLLKAGWESLGGVVAAIRDYRRLKPLNFSPPPFQRGLGFSSGSILRSLRG
ncbi:MAG: glycosyltransferase family 2 protein, partial [Calditrichota bacterium]